MDSSVGRISFFIAGVLMSVVLQASVTLTVRNEQGRSVTEVAPGVPFTIELACDGEHCNLSSSQTFKGLERCTIVGRSSHITMNNKNKKVSHTYVAYIAEPGTYTLGPVESGSTSSNVISLTVKAGAPSVTHDMAPNLFARLSVDKTSIVVGEKVGCQLKIFIKDTAYELRGIAKPSAPDISWSENAEPDTSTQMVDGVKYSCLTWSWDVFPTKAGAVRIEPFRIEYDAPIYDRSVAQALGMFGITSRSAKRVYSNDVTLSVAQLPAHDKPVQGIGEFVGLNARLNPSVAREGDGMVLTLELEGRGDFASIETPQLAMPEAFKWYESNQHIEAAKNKGSSKKNFEYIVQGMKPGDWELPAQEFTYFDTSIKRYKTLKTQPIMVSITPQVLGAKTQQGAHTFSDSQIALNAEVTDDIRPLAQSESGAEKVPFVLPAWLFIMLLMVPVIFAMRRVVLRKRAAVVLSRAQLFARARVHLHSARQHKAYQQLYPLFIEFFAGYFTLSPSEISEVTIESRLKAIGFLRDERGKDWHQFFMGMANITFGSGMSRSDVDLLEQAQRWLDLLEKELP